MNPLEKQTSSQIDSSEQTTWIETKKLSSEEKKLEWLKASLKYLGWYWASLDKWIKKLENEVEDTEDSDEIQKLKSKLKWLWDKYNEYSKDWKIAQEQLNIINLWIDKLQKGIDNTEFKLWIEIDTETWKIEKNEISNDELKKMNNRDFLELDEDKRLQYVTKNSVDSNNVSNWNINTLEFTFDKDWDWKDNKELFKLTTAWQVLPNEVREVESNWNTYLRIWLNGEFFSNSWERLKIYTWTSIEVKKVINEKEISVLENKSIEKYNTFIKENPNYWTEEYSDIIKVSFNKWLNWDEIEFILGWDFSKLWELDTNKAEKIIVSLRFLDNSKLLDDYSNAWEILSRIEDLKDFIDKYWYWIKYEVNNDWTIKFLWDWTLPEWLEKESSLKKLIQIATSQLWVREWNWWADKYLGGLDSDKIPWCAWYVNWVLKQSWYPSISWWREFSSKALIWEEWYGHVWFKMWDKIVWWNQWDKVSVIKINKPIVWWVMPENVWNMEKTNKWRTFNPKEIPDWAVIVFDRKVKNKQYS